MKQIYDVCVIGGSGAGLSAAIRAAEQGASVILLEKMAGTGGCSKMSGGIFGLNSPLQKAEGLEFDVDAMFKELMQVENWNCNGKLVRKWLKGAQRNIEWLMELGVEFCEVCNMSIYGEKVRRFHHVTADRQTGLNIWKALLKRVEELPVEMHTKAPAKELMVDETGRCCGVKAEVDGELVEILAHSVVLATGSISANKELVRRFLGHADYDNVRIMAAVPHCTGDGLLMAEQIGAKIGNVSILFIGPHNHYPGASEAVGCLPRRPEPIKVNRNGERFVDEAMSGDGEFGWMTSVAVDYQPGKVCYALMDEALLSRYIEERKIYRYAESRRNRNDKYPGEWFDRLRSEIKKEVEGGRAAVCRSLEEAAAFIGCDPETLKHTVATYNAAAKAGYDDEFLKSPKYMVPFETAPYYVFTGYTGIDTIIGGVQVDHEQRVLDREGKPIPGLFGAGVVTSGILSHYYGFPGTEMSYTLFSGQEAGLNAVACIKR